MASKRKGERVPARNDFVSFERHEILKSEFATCQRKLRSKEEAIRILHRELELCQEEKEEFARLMNHMKDYYLEGQSSGDFMSDESIETQDKSSSDRLTQLECLVRQMKHKHKEEVQSLKEKLSQARGVLVSSSSTSSADAVIEERTRLISELESTQSQVLSLVRQVQSLEDEKEDILTERDTFAAKCSSFSKMMEEKANSKPPSQSTLEKLLDENRQLKMELLETQADRDSAINKIERYKRAADRIKARDTQNQAIQFMSSEKLTALRQSVKRVQEMETLANSLSEELKEKSLALSHLRKTNRLLGSRIAELEHRLKVLEISGLWSTPVRESDEIDKEPNIDWNEDKEENEQLLVEENVDSSCYQEGVELVNVD